MMQNLKLITALIFTVLFANACRRDKDPLFDGVNCTGNCYVLTGTLVDSAVRTGIASGEIRFYFNDNTGIFSNRRTFIGKTITDANGVYNFKFDGSQFNNLRGYYFAEAFKSNMFADIFYPHRVGIFNLDTTLYNNPIVQNFPLFHPATIKVRIIASTVTNFQFLTISYSYGKAGSGIVLNGGRTIDTTLTWKTAGNLRTFIQSDAVGNGVNITKRDTILVPTNGTRQLEIRF